MCDAPLILEIENFCYDHFAFLITPNQICTIIYFCWKLETGNTEWKTESVGAQFWNMLMQPPGMTLN